MTMQMLYCQKCGFKVLFHKENESSHWVSLNPRDANARNIRKTPAITYLPANHAGVRVSLAPTLGIIGAGTDAAGVSHTLISKKTDT